MPIRSRRSHPAVLAALALVLVAASPGVAPAAAAPGSVQAAGLDPAALEAQALEAAAAQVTGPADTDLAWRSCYADVSAETGVGYECATLDVPLDHDEPGTDIGIALVRVPATNQPQRIGSLLLNPGGPGGSGIEFALFFAPVIGDVLGEWVPRHFDVVGFDPRGIGQSEPLRCFRDQQQADRSLAPFAFPVTEDEVDTQRRADRYLARRCARRSGQVGQHMSTANVARDMDRLREALGDEQLTYYGGSYGSFLGVTYANLFPRRVRAVAIDGIVDPIAWANTDARVPFSTRLRSDEGAAETLERFLVLCEAAGPAECSIAPDAAARVAALVERARAAPIVVPVDPTESVELTYADLIGFMLSILYDPFSYDLGAELLAALEDLAGTQTGDTPQAAVGEGAGDARASRAGARARDAMVELAAANPLVRRRLADVEYAGREQFVAVACEDSANPREYDVWSRAAAEAEETYGYFGPPWTWASSACALWSLADEDAYRGPFDTATSNPVLVLSTLYDPATRLEGAQTVRGLLADAALVTADVPAHTTLGASACAGYLTGLYLLSPRTAGLLDGVTCPQEFNPFLLSSLGDLPEPGLAPGLRHDLLSEVGLTGSG